MNGRRRTPHRPLALAACATFLVLASGSVRGAEAGETTAVELDAAVARHAATLHDYCQTCHNRKLETAGISIEKLDIHRVGDQAEAWEKIARKLRTRSMPPPGRRRPDDATYDGLADALEAALDRHAAANPNPGRPLLHRMNRAEYANAVRDLLAIEVDTSDLPADDSAFGFDNVADALGVSPLLLESYMTAARKVSRLAVGRFRPVPVTTTYKTPEDLTQDYGFAALPLGTRGGVRIDEHLPATGEYEIRVRLRRQPTGQIRGIDEVHRVELAIDGSRVELFEVGSEDAYKPLIANFQNPTQTLSKSFTADEHMHARVTLPAGPHTITAAFVGRPAALSEGTSQPFLRSYTGAGGLSLPDVEWVTITGPFEVESEAADTESRRRIFTCAPESAGYELQCATGILGRVARLAYRRPPTAEEMEELLGFYRRGRESGDFESGIELALRFLLASPQFVFRFESEPDAGAVAATTTTSSTSRVARVFPVSDLDLASRLSFFLWSSIPDAELLDVAQAGGLREPAELQRQVRRMLADPRSKALVENFAGQWLYLRNLASTVPDPSSFPDFDDNLRRAMRTETELFFASIVREDRGVVDLLDADYTFLNERLARHYGVPGVYGDRFRRVAVEDPNRRGLLGHASILTVTSYATRTSPVLRGKWILTNLLGSPPPPPPPDVPELAEPNHAQPATMRERLAQHRENAACASCHAKMDPLGFGLENFDAIGRFRSADSYGVPIDATDTLPDGSRFTSPAELRTVLLARPEVFVATFTEKLLTYALGRGLSHTDMPAVRDIVRRAAADDYRFSAIVDAITGSQPFLYKSAQPDATPAAVTAAKEP